MIYLDAAATTLQKPDEVALAIADAVRTCASPGRGSHAAALRAAERVHAVRALAAETFGASTHNVIFTHSATEALNIAILGLTKPGDTVVTSSLEHNAVMRPLYEGRRRVRTVRCPPACPQTCPEGFSRALRGRVRLCVCTAASNVFGTILPVADIARICTQRGIPLVVDASQAAGVIPLSISALGAAALCTAGHKGLYGPQGTGLLILSDLCRPRPLVFGGTGSFSAHLSQPDELPDRYESGTHNVPGILGLGEGLRYVRKRGEADILRGEQELIEHLCSRLSDSWEIHGRGKANDHTGVLALTHRSLSCEDVAQRLSGRGIAVRAGLCCAPMAHRTAGTLSRGVVRISVSDLNTAEEVRLAACALEEIGECRQ